MSALIAVALATWSVQDPSLSHATDGPVRNYLGTPGAIGADLLMQLFGLAATVLVLPVAVWGWRIATHRPFDREWMRLSFWLAGTVFGAGFASCLPKSAHWPLPTGLGGVIGDAMLRLPGAGVRAADRRRAARGRRGVRRCCTLAAVVIATGFGYHDPSDVKLDERWAREAARSRGRRRGAHLDLARLAGSCRAEHQGAHRPAGDAPLGAACAAARSRRAPTPVVSQRDRFEPRVGRRSAMTRRGRRGRSRDRGRAGRAQARGAASRRSARAAATSCPSWRCSPLPKPTDRFAPSPESIQETATSLESVLGDFGVRGQIINARPGPVVTLYELEPAPGIKSSRVIGLADDIARSMSALSARVAVVSGRNAIGIELPNDKREKVYLRELLDADDYTDTQAKLPLCLGKTIGGEPVIVDLARMPHLLIAGTTGSGKSVAINTMILSLLYRLHAGAVPADHGRSQDARALRL